MNIQDEFARWVDNVSEDSGLKRELEEISGDMSKISDCFYRELEFGTGGLRGKIGAGLNRINIYTVGRATQGLAHYLNENFINPQVCIAYDTRKMSYEFACHATKVLCYSGIKVFLFDSVRPTPMLSYAVRFKKASAGIVITASHNPKDYNGYKIYGADGGQITDLAAAKIHAHMKNCDIFKDVKTLPLDRAANAGLFQIVGEDVDSPYYAAVETLIMREQMVKDCGRELKIIYSPLNGAGNIPVRRVLGELGFKNVLVVPEQELPDGDFKTTTCPNPEEPSVFNLATKMAEREDADIIFATDPDCDRIGVMAKDDDGSFHLFTGNEIGALLCDYIIKTQKELLTLPENSAVIKTIVTSDLGKRICEEYGVNMTEVLTGFKYIGELAELWERTGEYSFLFGYEESCGYLSGNFVRDKDGIISSALIAEMALYHRLLGESLHGALNKLYEKYGYFAGKLIPIEMDGKEGQDKISAIMSSLREDYPLLLSGESLSVFEDYLRSVRVYCVDGKEESLSLPKSNVLKFIFRDQSWIVFRPSGTEPKIKIYLSASENHRAAADARLSKLEAMALRILKFNC